MNGINGVAAPPGLWKEARNPEGRVYYYNTITNVTQWTKPAEMMTPAEVNICRPLDLHCMFPDRTLTWYSGR